MNNHSSLFWRRTHLTWSSPASFVSSFALVIVLGSLLLWLPISASGVQTPYLDALFQSTSAVCVTGLATFDIGTRFSTFGQWTLLTLIQLGGLGVMTYSLGIVTLLQRKGSPDQQEWFASVYASDRKLSSRRMLKWIITMTVAFEAVGAILLTIGFLDSEPISRAVYHGVFHSISAFCNAGFALTSTNFMPFRDNVFINITTMALIIAGGLGFIVTFEVWRLATRQRRWFKLLLQTKLMLFGTLILIVVGAALIVVFETGGSFRGMSIGSQVLASFFQSVTARTAGFNTVDIGALSNSTLMVLILLMFIGAGPGSCAGGVKVTTVGILVLAVTSRLQEKPKAQAWNRSIPADTIRRAAALFAGSIFIILLSTLALQVTELAGASVEQARAFFLPLLFEVASAWGTVGLSTGVTPGLSAAGKIIVIGVMFIGRVGPLTLAAVLIGRGHSSRSGFVYPDEDVMIG